MKLNKKKVFALALAVCLIATLSLGSLAWFTDSDSAKNEFMIAGSEDANPDDIFSVDVWEDKDEDGVPDDEVEGEDEGLEYKDILPGDKLKKTVFVENTGSYDQYIRVTATISDAEAWINALGSDFNAADLFVGFEADKWVHVWNNLSEATEMPEDIIFVMYYKDALAVDGKIQVFTDVQIPTTLTQEQAAAFAGGFTIDIVADAVQTQNVVPADTKYEDAAWKAFQTVEGNLGAQEDIQSNVTSEEELKKALQKPYVSRVVIGTDMDVEIDYNVENKILDFNGTNSTVKFTSAATATDVSICGIVDTDGASTSIRFDPAFSGNVKIYNCELKGLATGAIDVRNGEITVSKCVVTGGSAAIANNGTGEFAGELYVNDCTFEDVNTAIRFNHMTGKIAIERCEFVDVNTDYYVVTVDDGEVTCTGCTYTTTE